MRDLSTAIPAERSRLSDRLYLHSSKQLMCCPHHLRNLVSLTSSLLLFAFSQATAFGRLLIELSLSIAASETVTAKMPTSRIKGQLEIISSEILKMEAEVDQVSRDVNLLKKSVYELSDHT